MTAARRWPHVTRAGALFLAALFLVGGGALWTGNNLLFLLLAAMLATLLVSGLIGRLGLAGLELELLLPEHIAARQRTPGRVRLRNLKSFFPSFSIEVSGPAILDRPLYFPLLSGGSQLDEPVFLEFPARGYHVENLFALSTRFPFGFVQNTARVTIRRETVIYPSLQGEAAYEEWLEALAGEAAVQVRGQGRDFYRVRPYQPSENARHVDWRSTAHSGEMQLREYAAEQVEAVEIYFDRRMPPGGEAAFESAVEFCAFIVWELTQRQIPLRVRSQAFEGTQVYIILKFLALVTPLAPTDAPIEVLAPHLLVSSFPPDLDDDRRPYVRTFPPRAD